MPAVDEDDVVRHPLRLAHHVRGEEDGRPSLLELAQEVADEDHVDGIESRLRLVEDDQLGIVQQRADELDLLLVALRELLDLRVALLAELEALQPAVDALGARRRPARPLISARKSRSSTTFICL